MTGAPPVPVASPHAGGNEDQICPFDGCCYFFAGFFCRFLANSRVTACTQASSQLLPNLQAVHRRGLGKGLRIGIDAPKLNAHEVTGRHPTDRVATPTPPRLLP